MEETTERERFSLPDEIEKAIADVVNVALAEGSWHGQPSNDAMRNVRHLREKRQAAERALREAIHALRSTERGARGGEPGKAADVERAVAWIYEYDGGRIAPGVWREKSHAEASAAQAVRSGDALIVNLVPLYRATPPATQETTGADEAWEDVAAGLFVGGRPRDIVKAIRDAVRAEIKAADVGVAR